MMMMMMMMVVVYLRSHLSDNYKDQSPGLHKRTLPHLGPYFSFTGTPPKLQTLLIPTAYLPCRQSPLPLPRALST